MRTIEVKEINISTKQGRLDWLEYKAKEDWTYLAETGMMVLFERVVEMKHWIIKGKGFFNCGVTNPFNVNLEITDLQTKYGQIEFKGSEDDIEKFVSELIKDESSFKMIDYFEKDSEEHNHYMYGPNNVLKTI